jgi:hypothetical protein
MIKYWSTPKIAGRLIAKTLTDTSDATGVYYDEKGKPMQASQQVSDPAFSDRYVAETRALLATVQSSPPSAATAHTSRRAMTLGEPETRDTSI